MHIYERNISISRDSEDEELGFSSGVVCSVDDIEGSRGDDEFVVAVEKKME